MDGFSGGGDCTDDTHITHILAVIDWLIDWLIEKESIDWIKKDMNIHTHTHTHTHTYLMIDWLKDMIIHTHIERAGDIPHMH
jgi:hypothetical protein